MTYQEPTNVDWLTTCPDSDPNWRIAFERASLYEFIASKAILKASNRRKSAQRRLESRIRRLKHRAERHAVLVTLVRREVEAWVEGTTPIRELPERLATVVEEEWPGTPLATGESLNEKHDA